MYLPLHYHHQNDSCIKMGSDENHFNVSLIVRDKVTRQWGFCCCFCCFVFVVCFGLVWFGSVMWGLMSSDVGLTYIRDKL